MLHFRFYSRSFLDVDPDAIGLPEGSFERGLPELLPQVVSPSDFDGFHKSDRDGAPSCCPMVLCAMLILQNRYCLPDGELVARCKRDVGFKYAIGLAADEKPPSVSSLVRFRRKVRAQWGEDWLHRAVLGLAVEQDLIPDLELQAVDSTNTNSRGAVIDTFNLISVGIGQVIRRVARCLGEKAEERAAKWELERYLARSIKGQVSIDWSDEEARNRLLTEEIRDADRLPKLVAALEVSLPGEVDEALELLRVVARQDVEQLPDGTYKIRRGTAQDRVISITDPEARHGRKSSSKVISGFKTHVQGTIGSQFVVGMKITSAGVHDAEPTPELVEQSAAYGLQPAEMVGDAAYGTGENRRRCGELGTEILTKLPSPSHRGSIPKRDFDIDLATMRVTCPQGQSTERHTWVKEAAGSDKRVAMFHFDKVTCAACPLRTQCCSRTAKGLPRTIKLSVYEVELQKAKEFAASERAFGVFRARSAIERLISHLVKMGMRQARYFGMHLLQFQGFLTAAAYNLQRIMTLKAEDSRRKRLGIAAT